MDGTPGSEPVGLETLLHHVALPPMLPGKQENSIPQIQRALTHRLIVASRILSKVSNGVTSYQWESTRRIIQVCKDLNADGRLTKASLLSEFRNLEQAGFIILHVSEQNAGLLVRRHKEGNGEIVIFEAFEASPLSEKALASESALQWDFPGCAVAIQYSDFAQPSFQENLAAFLEQASTESIKRYAAHTNKAGSSAYESRDTVDPSLITQMLMTLLEANGYRILAPILRKRVRDDVCWTDGAEIPWRRSPYWLVLRVGLQRHLYMLHGSEGGRVHYKVLLCLSLKGLLDDAVEHVSPELLTFVQAKLARRLAKLEVDKTKLSPAGRPSFEFMFTSLQTVFHKTMKTVNERVEVGWAAFKKSFQRPVPPLPRRADRQDLALTLCKSAPYLQQIMSWQKDMSERAMTHASYSRPMEFDLSFVTVHQFQAFANRYFSLSEFETDCATSHVARLASPTNAAELCIKLAQKINTYLDLVANAYDSNPEQKSIMLLTVMELWISMDQVATSLFGLLMDYSPGIPAKILDVLQLPYLADMARLQAIQQYLYGRNTQCSSSINTIFDDPVKGCFADRYFDESNDSSMMQDVYQKITTAAEAARGRKVVERENLSRDFEGLQRKIAESSCLFTTEDGSVIHDDRKCTKCYLRRKSKRMKIQIHEYPLPADLIQAKAVVFELCCPKAFSAYRNATWRIRGDLACPKQTEPAVPRLLLCDYTELKAFMQSIQRRGVCLASATKSFLATHNCSVPFPVTIDRVCLPNGLKLRYFDSITKRWTGRNAQKLTFGHHCQLDIPPSSPFSSLLISPAFATDANGPTSYEVIASQTKCPSGVNINEFMAYQGLFSGIHRRWPLMVIELGSSNLNFSTEATSLLISQLALQAGPAFNLDPLRAAHQYFRDEQFCRRLMQQVSVRLGEISSSWREINYMEMLLTLLLRLCCITSEPIVGEAVTLLERARSAILEWIKQLRAEIHRSISDHDCQRFSRYASLAALLCRRTFSVHPAKDEMDQQLELLRPDALECFIECSIMLQDNMTADPNTLIPFTRNALIRDLKMVFHMRFMLRSSFEASPDSLNTVINRVWPQSGGIEPKSFARPSFLQAPCQWWIMSTIHPSEHTRCQTVHYHLLEGHLLIDGRPIGKLPAEHRKSLVLEQLFGEQNLMTYPSALPGMTYTLAFDMKGHQIHIGFRDKLLIVQACIGASILELIPRHIFGDSSDFDLPASLIENCVHWLDIHTGIMEVRQNPDIWSVQKPGNWRLNFIARVAQRRNSTLVDPRCLTYQRIARIFDRFESRGRLTVFQPAKSNLSIEMRRLELSYIVNAKGLLECKQLQSEVDPNQDAGTWYGLNSKLVLRDTINQRKRSIIVPMGSVTYVRNRHHVAVEVSNEGTYGRFIINDVLGRLDCPAEPRLLYLKAHLHACTSFVIPDPLTGRTGTEEALHCLKSGYCQPWRPLNSWCLDSLISIAKLSPARQYYPKDMKVMQQVFWDPQLTTTIQNDAFRHTVDAIRKKSEISSSFALKDIEHPSLKLPDYSSHLSHRSCSRRLLYQRPSLDLSELQASGDLPYNGRECGTDDQARLNVFESSFLIRKRPSQLHTPSDLAGLLRKWSVIGGYDRDFDQFLLSDLLELSLATEWGSLVNLCRSSTPNDRYRLMFLFALITFRADVDMGLVRALIAFIVLDDLKSLEPPKWSLYNDFSPDPALGVDQLLQLIKGCCVPYPGDQRNHFDLKLNSKLRQKLEAAELVHKQQTEIDCKVFVKSFIEQWPCPEPTMIAIDRPLLINMSQAADIIRSEWRRLYQNLELSRHIEQVQQVLNRYHTRKNFEPPPLSINDQELLSTGAHYGGLPSLSQDLLRRIGPIISGEVYPININKETRPSNYHGDALPKPQKENVSNGPRKFMQVKPKATPPSHELQELGNIVDGIIAIKSSVHQEYGRDLKQSLNALKVFQGTLDDKKPVLPPILPTGILNAREDVNKRFNQLCAAFTRDDPRAQWLQKARLWPCITPITLLENLQSILSLQFGEGMKEGLVAYALSITNLQRLLRIEDAQLKNNDQSLLDEQRNPGHGNWNPHDYTDWLLLEIEANILIRHDQVEVALATISPASGANSVLQMNMGQGEFATFRMAIKGPITLTSNPAGKTSCIMPMVAAVLADSKNLVRVIVPNSLLLQTAQLLQARLGGLVGREVGHVPFSRKTPTKPDLIKAYYDVHKWIRSSSGVVIALPEHIMSFMLSGLQRLSDDRISESNQMVRVQRWIQKYSRDILDESDFTLAVRTQLIYPSGSQTIVDGHPHRWETAQALLRSVQSHVWNLQNDFPQSIEVIQRSHGGFPIIFFLRKDAEDALITRIVKDIVQGQTTIIATREHTQSNRFAIKQFISEAVVRPEIAQNIDRMFAEKPAMKQKIYLLRGLLVHRILLLTLKKRWNVQYGLHPTRDPIAVPFHAKGVPSEQAEWGHPDVAILFTCLAFYLGGLDLRQLRQSLENVLKSDEPSVEYDRWTYSAETLPGPLREWNVINVEDEAQVTEIWQHVRYKVVVIEYFLNHFVFPRHAKQFQTKLQASGWDLPLFSPNSQSLAKQEGVGSRRVSLTTGFSGTNDNRTMLPLTIKQDDLHTLSHTNAEVLTYLLQPRNRRYVLAADFRGKHLSELGLLRMLTNMKIRVLIDAGAQILEMDNYDLAKAWLKVDPEAPAAVYFNAENRLTVLYRKGYSIPLVASPFAENLGSCLVYLDEAHTRGTDLKMPANAKGALTLGLGQTKDHTVQAAMRLRQLGKSQSVVFLAPPEVHQSIHDLRKKRFGDHIDSYDVICWLLEQTCSGIEQIQPLHYSQGIHFCRRAQGALENPDFLANSEQRKTYLRVLRESEQQTLEQLYKPRSNRTTNAPISSFAPDIAAFMKELKARRKGFQDSGNAVHASALQEVEQEREVAFEVEAVREVQRPVYYKPLSFLGLHRDIVGFAKTGRLAAGSEAYEHVFVALKRTALGAKHGIRTATLPSKLFLTKEFTRTVSALQGRTNDNFLRQVTWILWSVATETALVIIPEEAELLIPLVMKVKKPQTHLLTYAAPVTRKMLHFNNLKYYTMPALPAGWEPPRWLTIELGIFAGRLYFDFDEYSDLLAYLGVGESGQDPQEISEDTLPSDEIHGVDGAGPAVVDKTREETGTARRTQSFTAKPLAFLQEWLAVRRKGQEFSHTPMGYVCQGKLLKASHPMFVPAENDGASQTVPQPTTAAGSDDHVRDETVDVNEGHSDGDFDEDEDDFECQQWQEDEQEMSDIAELSGTDDSTDDDVPGL
ncbi:MAG: hypothetical protein Q9163_000987 [Psora crenata]